MEQGAGAGELQSSQLGKVKGKTNQEGSSGQKPLPQPGQEMKVRDVRVAQPRLRVSPVLRGPGREHWLGRRALLLLVVGIQGGSERVLGQGFCVLSGGRNVPAPRRLSVRWLRELLAQVSPVRVPEVP